MPFILAHRPACTVKLEIKDQKNSLAELLITVFQSQKFLLVHKSIKVRFKYTAGNTKNAFLAVSSPYVGQPDNHIG